MIAEMLGHYRVVSELGSGGMGTVYLARDPSDRAFALKLVHPSLLETPGTVERLHREAEIGRVVSHPNVVRTYGCESATVNGRSRAFLVMEYVEGRTLLALLEDLGRVPEDLCRHIACEIAKGLAAIHEAGAVHRDLKPENVLITAEQAVKVMDLGVARLVDEAVRLSMSGVFVGSLLYASPEQFKGDRDRIDARSDLFSLGVLLYELSAGEHPHPGRDFAEVLARVIGEEPRRLGERNPQVSPWFEEVVRTLLEKRRDRRFRSAEELVAILENGEDSPWWRARAIAIRAASGRPLRRIRVPRETAVHGREEELDRLRGWFERSREGEGRVALIEGEAGVGKTRLMDELVERLRRSGEELNFVFGGYPIGGAATAEGAWATAYREQFGAEGLEDSLEGYLEATPDLLPAFAALLRGGPSPPGEERLEKNSIQTVFVQVTRALAAERPTVVLIEDLHLAPEEGRALFAALAQALTEARVLLVATMRPGLPDEWLAGIERLNHGSRLPLSRLRAEDVRSLLGEVLGPDPGHAGLAARIAAKSGGNPYFAFEILRDLQERELLVPGEDGGWRSTEDLREIAVPSSVFDLIQARVSGLADEDRNLLDAASCCGFEFDAGTVACALGRPRILVLQRLAGIERKRRLVRAAGRRFVFDHHQVQETLYATIPDALREEYHGVLGEAIENASLTAGDPVAGETAVALCHHYLRGPSPHRAHPYVEDALGHLTAGLQGENAVALADLALTRSAELPAGLRIDLLLHRAVGLDLLDRRTEQKATLEEAEGLAADAGDPIRRVKALNRLTWCLVNLFETKPARVSAGRAASLAAEIGERKEEATAVGHLGLVLLWTGRTEEARAELRRSLELFRAAGFGRGERIALGNLALAEYHRGDWREAERLYAEQYSLCRAAGDRLGEAKALAGMVIPPASLGRLAEARELCERHLALARRIGHRGSEADSSGNLGIICAQLGLAGPALDALSRQIAICREIGYRLGEGNGLLHLAGLLANLGDLEASRLRSEEALGIMVDIEARTYEAEALSCLAIVASYAGDSDEAERMLGEAIGLWRQGGDPPGLALALIRRASLRVREGRRLPEARADLEEALATGRELDAAEIVILATVSLLRLTGRDPGAALALYAELEPRLPHLPKMEASHLLFEATEDGAHLDRAHRLLMQLRDHAPEPYRESVLTRVPLHREILARRNRS